MKRLLPLLLLAAIWTGCAGDDDPIVPDSGQETDPDDEQTDPDNGGTEPDDVSGIRLTYDLTQRRSAKRGVSYTFRSEGDVLLLADGISWSYNWGPDVAGAQIAATLEEHAITFYPMAWNGKYSPERIRAWRAAHPDSEYLLAFNEPNLTDQASMTPQEAAAEWPGLKALADELGMKLVAPAMNYGTLEGYGDPIVWLDEFFSLVPVDDVEGIAIHCYMGTPSAVKSYVQRFYKYGKPIWMTEFCGWEKNNIGSIEAQRRYMAQVVGYLEADEHVAAYAWFIPRGSGTESTFPYNPLLTSTAPYYRTVLGELYCNYTSLDRSARFAPQEVIPAEQFVACHATETAGESGWTAFPDVQPTTDATGILELADLYINQWVEYAVSLPAGGSRPLYLRYTAPQDTVVEIACGAYAEQFTLAKTGDGNWQTVSLSVAPEAGDQELRLKVVSGRLNLNWLSLR